MRWGDTTEDEQNTTGVPETRKKRHEPSKHPHLRAESHLILNCIVLIYLRRRRLLCSLRLALLRRRRRRRLVIHLHLRVLRPILLLRTCRPILRSLRLRLSFGLFRGLFGARFSGGVRQLDVLLRLARSLRPRLFLDDALSQAGDLCDACTTLSYKGSPFGLRRCLDLRPVSVMPLPATDLHIDGRTSSFLRLMNASWAGVRIAGR